MVPVVALEVTAQSIVHATPRKPELLTMTVLLRQWLALMLKTSGLSLAIATLLALTMTLLDWIKNPTQLFHNDQGTNWDIVLETALSWFWPSLTYLLMLSLIYVCIRVAITATRQKN